MEISKEQVNELYRFTEQKLVEYYDDKQNW